MDTTISSINSDEKVSESKKTTTVKTEQNYKSVEETPPPYIYKLNRNFKNTVSSSDATATNTTTTTITNTNTVSSKHPKLFYENETCAKERKFDSLDTHQHHHNHHKMKCDKNECAFCSRRYSAADAVNLMTTSATIANEKTSHPSPLLKETTSTMMGPTTSSETTSVIKKSSNLKKSNSNFLKPKIASGEKVKFSDVELRHLISDRTLDEEEAAAVAMVGGPEERFAATMMMIGNGGNVSNQRKLKQQSLPPLFKNTNTKRSKKMPLLHPQLFNPLLDQFQYDKLCSLQQLRTNSSPPEGAGGGLVSGITSSRKLPRRLKYSNTLSILDLEQMRSRSIGRDYAGMPPSSSMYYLEDYEDKRNKDFLYKKQNSQSLIDDEHLSKLYNKYVHFI
jgi:hypothetical protein